MQTQVWPELRYLASHRPLDRPVEIGVVEDDERGVSAELHRNLLHRPGRLTEQHFADLGRARERDLLHQRIASHLSANRTGRAGQDVDDARRDAGGLGEDAPGEAESGVCERRLDHDRAARGECRGELARDHRGREIPGRDRRDHADRLLGDEDAAVGPGGGDHVPIHPPRLLGEPQDIGRGHGDLATRLGQRLALLAGQQPSEILLVLGDQAGEPTQEHGALGGTLCSPCREGGVCRLDRSGGSRRRPAFGTRAIT